MPLAFTVLCMGPSQATSSGSHEGIKGGLPAKSVGERAALVLSLACKNYRILSIIRQHGSAVYVGMVVVVCML